MNEPDQIDMMGEDELRLELRALVKRYDDLEIRLIDYQGLLRPIVTNSRVLLEMLGEDRAARLSMGGGE